MPEQYKSSTEIERAPVIEPGHTFGTVTEKISAIVLTRPASNGWFIGFGLMFMATMMLLFALGYLFVKGVGSKATVVDDAKATQGRLFSVAAPADATFASLELAGGTATSDGGGALSNLGVTTLDSVLISGSSAPFGGGL